MGPVGVSADFVQSEGSEFACRLGHAKVGAGNLRTFSLQMVSITSSGGVPSNSVIIENWFTSTFTNCQRLGTKLGGGHDVRSFPGKRGFPSSISAKMHPVLQMSTATSYFCHVSMISGAR